MPHYVITYTNTVGANFDFDYYLNTHLPLSNRLLKPYGFLSAQVEQGQSNSRGERPAFICMTRLYFEDKERMHAAFAAHGKQLRDDIVNYTTIEPTFTPMKQLGKKMPGLISPE